MISTDISEKKNNYGNDSSKSKIKKKIACASVTGVFPAFAKQWFSIMEKHQLKIKHSWLWRQTCMAIVSDKCHPSGSVIAARRLRVSDGQEHRSKHPRHPLCTFQYSYWDINVKMVPG